MADTETEPKESDKQQEPKQESAESKQGETSVNPMADFQAELAALKQQQNDIMAAVSALANQGAVNASVNADNGGSEDDYPTIDLNEINRLIGA